MEYSNNNYFFLFQGLDSVSSTGALRSLDIHAPRIDSYRFSMANLEDSQDVDLDAILGELCALETQCDREIDRAQANRRISGKFHPSSSYIHYSKSFQQNCAVISYIFNFGRTLRSFSCKIAISYIFNFFQILEIFFM